MKKYRSPTWSFFSLVTAVAVVLLYGELFVLCWGSGLHPRHPLAEPLRGVAVEWPGNRASAPERSWAGPRAVARTEEADDTHGTSHLFVLDFYHPQIKNLKHRLSFSGKDFLNLLVYTNWKQNSDSKVRFILRIHCLCPLSEKGRIMKQSHPSLILPGLLDPSKG